MLKRGLVVVDVQVDFCPGGALAVRGGDEIVPRLNRVVRAFLDVEAPIAYTRDWHPFNHISFQSRGGPWPPHCVADTPGASFHPSLLIANEARLFSKGVDKDAEAYSGFQGTGLAVWLKTRGVEGVAIGGLATDYCVKETALDAMKEGFEVELIEDCIRAVDTKPGDGTRAMERMKEAGVTVVSSDEFARRVVGSRPRAEGRTADISKP